MTPRPRLREVRRRQRPPPPLRELNELALLVRRGRGVAARVLPPHCARRADHAALLVERLDLHDRTGAPDQLRGLEATLLALLGDHRQLPAALAVPDPPGRDLGRAVPAHVD